MNRPTAAKGTFPYPHRTVAEVWAQEEEKQDAFAFLERLSRQRALTEPESRRLERLLKVAA